MKRARRISSSSTPTTDNRSYKKPKDAVKAKKDRKEETVEITPVSDVIWTQRGPLPEDASLYRANDHDGFVVMDYVPSSTVKGNDKTCRYDYYDRLAVQHVTPAFTTVKHVISNGDVVAFSNSEQGAPEAPFSKDAWSVGQVICLAACKISPTHKTFYAMVKWLPRWKKEFQRDQHVPEDVRKEFKSEFRPDQALVETQQVFMVNIRQQILPVQVCLKGWKEFIGTKFISPELMELEVNTFDIFQVYFNCVLLHRKSEDNNDDTSIKLIDVRKEWDSYHVNNPTAAPSGVLRRGWALLRDPALEKALETHYKTTVTTRTSFEKYRSQWSAVDLRNLQQNFDDEEEDEIVTIVKPKVAKAKTKQIASSKRAMQPTIKLTTAPSKKVKGKSAKRISFNIPNDAPTKKRKVIKVEEQTDSVVDKGATDVRDASTRKISRSEHKHKPLVFEARERPVYVYRPPNKISQQTTSNNTRTTFYSSVCCKLNPYQQYHEKFLGGARKKKTQQELEWTIHIGDVVAVRSSKDESKSHHSGSMIHYPYMEPWAVGQVLSISSTTGEGVPSADKTTSDFELELRWFCSLDEMNEDVREEIEQNAPSHVRNGSCLIEMDEFVGKVRAQILLGPIHVTSTILSSSPKEIVKRRCKKLSGIMPHWTVSCQDYYESKQDSKHLYSLKDWPSLDDGMEDFSSPRPDPIRRGLYCERGKPHKLPKLQKKYEMILRQRLVELVGWNKSEKLHHWAPNEYQRSGLESKQKRFWSDTELNPSVNIVSSASRSDRLHSSNGKEFYKSIRLLALKQRCDPRAVGSKADEINFGVSVGNVVCLADNEAILQKPNSESNKAKRKLAQNIFYPFLGPFSAYQVLAIYKIQNSQQYFIEGRRLFRPEELPIHWLNYLPDIGSDAPQIPHLFESNMMQDSLPVSRILGHVNLSLGPSFSRGDSQIGSQKMTPELTLQCHCSYYYNCARQHIQPLYVADSCPKKWMRRFLERGLSFSEHCSNSNELRRIVESSLSICLEAHTDTQQDLSVPDKESQVDVFAQIFNEMRVSCEIAEESEKRTETAFIRHPSGHDTARREFLTAVRVNPPFSKYQQVDKVCHPRDRVGRLWTIRVGDVIAVSRSASDLPKQEMVNPDDADERNFPFTEEWDACQVLSISQTNVNNGNDKWDSSLCSLEVRELKSANGTEDTITPIRLVSETPGDSPTQSVPLSGVLGPLSLGLRVLDKFQWAWKSMIRFLPACPLALATLLNFKEREEMESYLVTRAIEQSKEYKQSEKEMINAIMLQRNDDDSSRASDTSSTKSSETQTDVEGITPIHTDTKTGTNYYQAINVSPDYDSFASRFVAPFEGVKWRVSLGDIVCVRTPDFFAPLRYGPKNKKASKTDPFEVSVSIGEIVSISLPGASSSGDQKKSHLLIEIRWFYRLAELKGRILPNKGDSEQLSEEVLESDHLDVVPASSLISPAILHEMPVDVTQSEKTYLGMPVIDVLCNRYFSIKRMAPVPCGSLSGRVARGRLLSTTVARDAVLSEKLEREHTTSTSKPIQKDPVPPRGWRENYRQVISKLSLSDASKEGFEGQFVMVGRENERKKINSFLKGAILGTGKDANNSIFIAGPPGTGKTASVFAAIRELRTKHVCKFNFVYMNGMEMRHPFEAYVQLWERVGGKSQCTPELAAAKLESYFTDDEPGAESEVTVVLLDEIDYLVTKNQSVLYNFFDWPLRSCNRKLVLLGISNTLNLPEHMHPRVQSRIGNRRCIFNAYTSDQIKAILESKVTQASPHFSVFASDALVFASKKTAAQSGDLRKAFRICRLAAEQVLSENPKPPEAPTVGIKDVLKVSRESFHSAHSKAAALCSQFEALVLVVLALLYRSTGREVGGFDVEELVLKMEAVSNAWGNTLYLPPPSLAETLDLLRRLGEVNLVSLRSQRTSSVSCRASLAGSGGPWPLVSLLVEDTAVFHALKSTCHKELAQKYLGR